MFENVVKRNKKEPTINVTLVAKQEIYKWIERQANTHKTSLSGILEAVVRDAMSRVK